MGQAAVAQGEVVAASPRRGGGDARRLLWGNAALAAAILLSAWGVIFSTHDCRALYAQLQELESSQWYLQEDYGRLLLEQSTWASHYRIEKVARTELGMQAPDMGKYKLVPR